MSRVETLVLKMCLEAPDSLPKVVFIDLLFHAIYISCLKITFLFSFSVQSVRVLKSLIRFETRVGFCRNFSSNHFQLALALVLPMMGLAFTNID